MKTRWSCNIKIRQRTIAEFKTVVKDVGYTSKARILITDKRHTTEECVLRCGSFAECYELCSKSGITLITYQGIY